VRFYNTFVDILSVIGYWSASFAGIVLADHFVVRRCRWYVFSPFFSFGLVAIRPRS
jgi:purine-cytosine permease-like protein